MLLNLCRCPVIFNLFNIFLSSDDWEANIVSSVKRLHWVNCIRLHINYMSSTTTLHFCIHQKNNSIYTIHRVYRVYKRYFSFPIYILFWLVPMFMQWMLLALPDCLCVCVCVCSMYIRRFGRTERVLCDWFNYWRVKCNFAQIQMPFNKHACGLCYDEYIDCTYACVYHR